MNSRSDYAKLLKYRDSIRNAILVYKEVCEIRNRSIRLVSIAPSQDAWNTLSRALNRERTYLKLFSQQGQKLFEGLNNLSEKLVSRAVSPEEKLFAQNAARLTGIVELFLDYQKITDESVRKNITVIERTHSLNFAQDSIFVQDEVVQKIINHRNQFEQSFDSLFGPRSFALFSEKATIEGFLEIIAARSLQMDQAFAAEAWIIALVAVSFLSLMDALASDIVDTRKLSSVIA